MSTSPPTPGAYPTAGNGRAGSWSCYDNYVTPTPTSVLGPTPPPYVAGEDCAVTTWQPENPYPVASVSVTAPAASAVACPSPASADTPVAECQIAYDAHRLSGFTVMAGSVVALLLVALLLVVFGVAVRRVA